ncbi:MAG: hypothetical protein ACI9WV_000453 [Patiriisocius sp.]
MYPKRTRIKDNIVMFAEKKHIEERIVLLIFFLLAIKLKFKKQEFKKASKNIFEAFNFLNCYVKVL